MNAELVTRSRRVLEAVLAAAIAVSVFGQSFNEYQVKAAFLFNFANFVEWPEGTFTSTDEPFTVCLVGRSPIEHAFEPLAGRTTADGRSFAVREIGNGQDTGACQIVFISASERLRYRSIVEKLRGSILVVGETSDFVAQGGAVELLLSGNKIRMVIDARPAKERKLRISSHLLRLAQGAS
jgi:hypothetical protein